MLKRGRAKGTMEGGHTRTFTPNKHNIKHTKGERQRKTCGITAQTRIAEKETSRVPFLRPLKHTHTCIQAYTEGKRNHRRTNEDAAQPLHFTRHQDQR